MNWQEIEDDVSFDNMIDTADDEWIVEWGFKWWFWVGLLIVSILVLCCCWTAPMPPEIKALTTPTEKFSWLQDHWGVLLGSQPSPCEPGDVLKTTYDGAGNAVIMCWPKDVAVPMYTTIMRDGKVCTFRTEDPKRRCQQRLYPDLTPGPFK